MSIPIPSGMTRGRVSWRIGHDRAGSTLPGASGTVRFEPTAVAVAYSTATVLPAPVETPVIGGVMTPVDLQVNDPDIWNWKVRPRVGVAWEPFHVDVPGPVDLATAAVVPGVGPVRAVKGDKGDTPAWGDLPGKPTTFPATAHQHTLDDVDGLTARLATLKQPAPTELGVTHLDTVLVPGTYVCRTTANAQLALGYPYEGVSGTLVVLPWNPALPRVIAIFYPWSERPVAKRTSNSDGTWRAWVDMLGNPIT